MEYNIFDTYEVKSYTPKRSWNVAYWTLIVVAVVYFGSHLIAFIFN